MSPTRREFVVTMGTAAASLAFARMQGVFWQPEEEEDLGWTPGIEQRLVSACLVCPARCGIQGRIVDGRLVRIVGNRLHPMSRGGVCPRGVAGVQLLYHPERLASPLVRSGPRGSGQWTAISREEAIARIADQLRTLRAAKRPESLALLAGYCAGTMKDVWRQFLHSFGSPNYVADDYQDGTDAVMALMHGIARRPSYDLDEADLVLSFGAPLFESWWSPLQAFVAYGPPDATEGNRPHFVQIDTRFSRTAAHAHEWVGIKPGTHAVLALGIAYVLIRDELFDAEFVAEHVRGFDDFTDERGRRRAGYASLVTRNYRSEEVSAITGVPVERIAALAKAVAESQRPLAVCGTDVTFAPNGLLAAMAVHSLNVLMGRIARPGGILFRDDPPLEPLPDPRLDATARAGLARRPVAGDGAAFSAANHPLDFAQVVAASAESPIEALLIYYANPLASSSRPELWREALGKIPFLVSFSPFMDETTRQADLVLPDLLPYERWQDAPAPSSYPYPVWGLARPLVEPFEGGTHTGDAVLAIARSLGGAVRDAHPYDSFQALLEARARGLFNTQRGMVLGNEIERRHHRQMEERGWWLPTHTDFEDFWDNLVERGGWTDLFFDYSDPAGLARTKSGRIELVPEALLGMLATEDKARTPYVDVAIGAPSDSGPEEYPLRLLPYRVSTLASGTQALERWFAEKAAVYPEVYWSPWIEVAPATARSQGFGDGTMVWVISPHGRYQARLKLFPGAAPDTVCAPYGLRHPDGGLASPLRLLDGSTDGLTGLESWVSTFVRLERV